MRSAAIILITLAMTVSTTGNISNIPHSRPQTLPVNLEPVASNLDNPVFITASGDHSDRLFIVEQPGRIRVRQPNGSLTTFLDIRAKVLFGGERGLLGLAFHPQFRTNGRFFVDYTRRPDGATVIAEYRVSASDENIADPAETVLLVIAQPFANHNGGMLAFGPDGFLYIGMGDGGSANDPGNRAQNLQQLLGKILRIDIDHSADGRLYSSPRSNPFFGSTQFRNEIYALGLRNPWRFSFDRATGDLYVGDVGQNAWEEIDIVVAGANYGWRVFEGNHCTGNDAGLCSFSSFSPPIAEYSHSGGRCSITGGYVYRGAQASLPFGAYVFADFCTGEIFLLQGKRQSLLMDTAMSISSFGEDESGEIYVVDIGGSVFRFTNPSPPPPPSDEFKITSALLRRRSTGAPLQPATVQLNAKKFDVIVSEDSPAPNAASFGSVVFVNGVGLATSYEATDLGTPIFVAKLKKKMLRQPGQLIVEVVRRDGTRSNQLVIEILPATRSSA